MSPTSASAEFFSDVIVTSPNGIWTDSRAYSTLNAAITAVGADQRTVKIVSPQVVTTLTVPANVTLVFERDGSINNSGQLTINTRNISAGSKQIFTGVGDIDFAAGSVVKTSWFPSLYDAINLTSDASLTLLVDNQAHVTTTCALGNNVTLKWDSPNNIIQVDAGVVFSNIKNIEAGNYQIFAGTGDYDFLDGTKLKLNWFNSLHSVVAQVESEKVTIEVSDENVISYDDTIPTNMEIKVLNGGILNIDAGRTLTINGPFSAGLYQVFSGDGSVAGLRETNVLWFGATGDGATDNQAAFVDAFASVIAGGEVFIPKQSSFYSYNNDDGLSDAVDISQSTIVKLDGTIKSTNSTNQADPPFIFNVTEEYVTFKGTGTLQGPGTFVVNETDSTHLPGLIKVSNHHCTIEGITFVDGPEVSIFLANPSYVKIHNCDFTGGPLVADATSSQHYYIHSRGGDHHLITDNSFYADSSGGSTRTAIDYTSSIIFNNLIITDNHFLNIHEHATYLTAITDSVISNNTVRYEQAAADQLGNALKVGGDRNIVSGNTLYNCAKGGIAAYDSSNSVIANNTIYNFGQIGISITDNVANTVGFSYNTIDSNVLEASTDGRIVLNGISYIGTATTTADCIGGKITNNTIIAAGSTTADRAAISVYHTNVSYSMIDFDISYNKIRTPKNISIYLVNVTESVISFNSFKNPGTASSRFIYIDTVTNCTIEGNIGRDDQSPALTDSFLRINGVNNLNILLLNNSCFTTGNAAGLGKNPTYNITGRGNRLSEDYPLTGTFTMNNVATCLITNHNFENSAVTGGNSVIRLTPLNGAAGDIIGSAYSLYVYTATAKTSFSVRTANTVAVAAVDAIFAYEIIQ